MTHVIFDSIPRDVSSKTIAVYVNGASDAIILQMKNEPDLTTNKVDSGQGLVIGGGYLNQNVDCSVSDIMVGCPVKLTRTILCDFPLRSALKSRLSLEIQVLPFRQPSAGPGVGRPQ